MKHGLILAVFLVGLNRLSASPAEDDQKLATANNGFAFNLLKQIAKERPGTNIFISPYSISTALRMVVNGAGGQTKVEMQRVLGISDMSVEEMDATSRAVNDLLALNQTNVVLTTANSVWHRQNFLMKPDFTDANQKFFRATVKALDFDNRQAAEAEISQWGSDQTQGRIKGIGNGLIHNSTAVVLADAVYFKGKWLETFDKKLTKPRSFHLASGSGKKVPMMESTLSYYGYSINQDCQIVRLPYKGRNLAMFILLPDESTSLEKFLLTMNGEHWRNMGIQNIMGYRKTYGGVLFTNNWGQVVLPKFKFEDDLHLIAPLKALGIRSAFDNEKADFSGMTSDSLWLSEVCQKTFVEVDEEGTEAAAVTVVRGTYGAPEKRPKPFQLIVDRPFLFLIEDSQTGTLLFMGLIFNPQTD